MDLSKFGDMERTVIKAFERNDFDKFGVRETCRILAEKYGWSANAVKTTYGKMKKFGAFELLFPDRFKDLYVPFATRLKTSNIEKLDELRKASGKSKQEVVNKLIEDAE